MSLIDLSAYISAICCCYMTAIFPVTRHPHKTDKSLAVCGLDTGSYRLYEHAVWSHCVAVTHNVIAVLILLSSRVMKAPSQ